jgi:UDP-2-acetamido-3-amino-2,3-dideoxy-glucuronate N-acetyltransferase
MPEPRSSSAGNVQPPTHPHAGICVAGYGHWGKNLTRNFAALGHLYAVCENSVVHRDACTQQYPGLRTYSEFTEALADPGVAAVALATPAEHHCRMALQALDAGKNVFVEKPLALDWQEGWKMVEAARRVERILMVGHLLRYHPAIIKIQELYAQGILGRIDYIYSNRLSMGKIRQEENALWSFAPHDISVILALMGKLPIQVSATGGAYLQPNIADVTLSSMLFDQGSRAHIFVSWLHPYKEQRLAVIGSKQIAVFEDSRPDHKLVLFDKSIEWKNGVPEAGKPQGTPVEFGKEEPLRQECAHFIDCVLHRKSPLTTGEEGVQVLQVLQSCQRSLQMNGEPVQVNLMLQKLLEL